MSVLPVLADAFLRKHSNDERIRFSDGALRRMMRGSWPGNARELENCIERALALSTGEEIAEKDILIPADGPAVDGTIEELLLRLKKTGSNPEFLLSLRDARF